MTFALTAAYRRVMWLQCQVEPGMFPDEFSVIVAAEGAARELFVDRRLVMLAGAPPNGTGVEGRLRVDLLEQDERFGIVLLPTEPFHGGRTAVVRRHLLEAE